MRLFINGNKISQRIIRDYANLESLNCYSDKPELEENVLKLLNNWFKTSGYSFGCKGDGFLNLNTSGTTGTPKRVVHSRETIEQVVDSNINILNLDKNSRILSCFSPRGIAFSVLAVYLGLKLKCDLYIESFRGINYIDRIHQIRPTHTLLLPNVWKTLHKHNKWKTLDYSSIDTLITGSDFTPKGMLDELREHGPNKVYNVYGSTEVPPILLYSEEENVYTSKSLAPGGELDIIDNQICCKWSSQSSAWMSGDYVEGDKNHFKLCGRAKNMFKQDVIRVFPEQIEKAAVAAGADLALCQQVNNHCTLYYTGRIDNSDDFAKQFEHIPRFRLKSVKNIEVDNNLKKVIRTQTF